MRRRAEGGSDGGLRALDGPALRLVRREAASLLHDRRSIADAVSVHVLARHPELTGDGGTLVGAAGRAAEANVVTLLESLARGDDPEALDIPDGNLDLVRDLAQRTDGLPLILRALHTGLAAFRRHWIDHLGGRIDDAGTLAEVVVQTDVHITACADRVADVLTDRWVALVRDARTADIRRAAVGRALLDGEAPDLAAIGHPADRPHLVLAARGVDGAHQDGARLLRRVAEALGAVDRLEAVAPDGSDVWWVATPGTTIDRATVARVFADAPAEWWCVTAACPAGVEQLTAAADDVRAGLAVLRRISPAGDVAEHADVALLTALLADPDRAARFATAVLGPLADGSARSARLRDTLRAYFAAGERKSGAAAVLGIHEKTVAYRLRAAETALGAPVRERRADLEAALLVLSAVAPQGPPVSPL